MQSLADGCFNLDLSLTSVTEKRPLSTMEISPAHCSPPTSISLSKKYASVPKIPKSHGECSRLVKKQLPEPNQLHQFQFTFLCAFSAEIKNSPLGHTNPMKVRFCFDIHIPGSACLVDEIHLFNKQMRRLQPKIDGSILHALLRKKYFSSLFFIYKYCHTRRTRCTLQVFAEKELLC